MRKMLNQNTENKEVGQIIEDNVPHNSAIGNADMLPIVPQIASGTDGSSRLGDRVKPKSLVVRGVVSVDENPNTIPFYVRVIIASQKDVKVGSKVTTDCDSQHLLRTAIPGASEIPFSGNRKELLYRVNDNKFRVYMDKTYLIAPVSAASGNDAGKSQFAFSYTFKEKQLPAHFSFDEGNGDWVNNFAPFITLGYAYADGSSPDTVTTRINVDSYSLLTYEDA